jgi:hypothetical protein
MDLTQKLRERPTPKFSEAVASCGGAAVIGCGVGAKLLVGKNFALVCLFKTRV